MLGFTTKDFRTTYNFFSSNVRDKYMGSSLGSLWSIANPLLMLSIFTFVFGYVYKVRLPGAETTLAYAIWLIGGYGPWISVTESITASATSLTGASGIIKNLTVKTEILPIAAALTGIVPLLVSLGFLLILLVADGRAPSAHLLALPLIVAIQIALVLAIGILVAGLTVFFRDLTFALPNLLTIVLFASPIFYPIDSMPRIAQSISNWNPFYILAESYRAVLIGQSWPASDRLAYVLLLAGGLGVLSLSAFRRLKGFFAALL
jgi:lipopolysaccharide transport system permease protein